jgi:hypothetical protein
MPALRGTPEWVGVQSGRRRGNGFRRAIHVDIRRLVARCFDSAQSASFWRAPRTARGFPRAPSITGGEAGRSQMDGAGRILRKRAASHLKPFARSLRGRAETRAAVIVVVPHEHCCSHTMQSPATGASEKRINQSLRRNPSSLTTRPPKTSDRSRAWLLETSRPPDALFMQRGRSILRRAARRSMRHWSWAGGPGGHC